MAATKLLDAAAFVARFGGRVAVADEGASPPRALACEWPELDAVLPDGGLPLGVVELAAPHALGGSTSIALSAVRAAQRRDARSYAAWVDADATLYGPGVAMAGVDLARLLVVRPPRRELGRIALKVAQAGAFDVVVVDMHALPGVMPAGRAPERARGRRGMADEVLVRKLALAAEDGGATVLLLSDSTEKRALPWPVSLRLELSRTAEGEMALKVTKDRRGRIGIAKAVPLGTRPGLAPERLVG